MKEETQATDPSFTKKVRDWKRKAIAGPRRTYELAALAILTLDVERPEELIILKILIFLVIVAIIVLGVYVLDRFLKRKKKKDEKIV